MRNAIVFALLAAAISLTAAPQYSGSEYTTTFTADGVKQDLINSIETALNNTGATACGGGTNKCWTTQSGHGTTNLLMQSGTTTAGSLQINARFKDNGGTGIQVYLENTAGTLKPASYATTNGCPLLATNGLAYTVVASKYQFLIFAPAGYNTAREFCWVGMPYLTSDLASNITNAGFLFGSSIADSDGTFRAAITACTSVASIQCTGNGSANYELMLNTNWWESSNNAAGRPTDYIGAPRLFFLMPGDESITGINTTQQAWNTSTAAYITSDVYIGWGAGGTSAATLIQGQIYDCVYISTPQSIGTTATWSSHNWYELTNSYTGLNQQLAPGGFWFATS